MDWYYNDSTNDVLALLSLAAAMTSELGNLLWALKRAVSPCDKGHARESHATTQWSWLNADVERMRQALIGNRSLITELSDARDKAKCITEVYGKASAGDAHKERLMIETANQTIQPLLPAQLPNSYVEAISDFKEKAGIEWDYSDSTNDVLALLSLAAAMTSELGNLLWAAQRTASPCDKGYSIDAHATTHWSWLHADIERLHHAVTGNRGLASELSDAQCRAKRITEVFGTRRAKEAQAA